MSAKPKGVRPQPITLPNFKTTCARGTTKPVTAKSMSTSSGTVIFVQMTGSTNYFLADSQQTRDYLKSKGVEY